MVIKIGQLKVEKIFIIKILFCFVTTQFTLNRTFYLKTFELFFQGVTGLLMGVNFVIFSNVTEIVGCSR